MVQQCIYESDAKDILRQNLIDGSNFINNNLIIDNLSEFDCIETRHQWIHQTKLVLKPDQAVKGRGLAGAVILDYTWDQIKTWLSQNFGREFSFGKTSGKLSRFLVEPFVAHAKSNEHYLCIYEGKDFDYILYSTQGGIDIGNINQKCLHFKIKINEEIDSSRLFSTLFSSLSAAESQLLLNFTVKLFDFFRNLHFTYLELNPLIVQTELNKITIVDVAAKIDTCAEFLCAQKWQILKYPPPFGNTQLESEMYIANLDKKSGASLKFVVLNKDGRVWTIVAGGGASVVYSDTICDLGFSNELANYGEYSGAPTTDETYEYSVTIMRVMVSAPKHPQGKILIIAGGIANFTDVAVTFNGIINALKEMAPKLIEHNVRIFVRRGGPNYEQGLRNIKEACDKLNLVCFVFGIDIHMTSVVAMALGLKPIENNIEFGVTDTVNLPAREPKSALPSFTSCSFSLDTPTDELFDSTTTAIIWGYQEVAIQGMLDFDYLCKKSFPSVCCMIYPFRASYISKFYFGLKEIFIPIYGTFEEACSKFPNASVLINFASMRSSYEVSLEALNFCQFKIISIFAEGIPERQTQLINAMAKDRGVLVIGPASLGGIKPGSFRIGHAGGIIDNISASKLYRPGSVAYITRSGGMSNELNNILARITDGVYQGVHLGGDRYPGSSYMDYIDKFCASPAVELIVVLGEVGGMEEYLICDALKSGKITKPIVVWCIGTCSSYFDNNIQFGHANACADQYSETSVAKNKALKEAGAYVPESFDQLAELIGTIYFERVNNGLWNVKPEVVPPPIPVDYKYARQMGLIRKPTSFISTICDERGQEPSYSGYSISQILEQNIGIGGTLGLLWFQRLLPQHMNRFLEMCIIILADHGPAVTGAHNTIVTARAGKDMLSALCSGLLTIGDRFGGAINGAAKQFWNAFQNKLSPSVFVSEMRKKGELILGIGHLVKSVTNPDERVCKIIKFVKAVQTAPLLDFALEVEKITTSKKSNLILNVDGAIAVCMIDMMLQCGQFSEEDVQLYINLGAFNAIFILSRSIGFIGHFIDQKRLKQGLYRHPWDDISFINKLDINK